MSDKKKEQLGMNPSTASGRLVKDLLWSLILKTNQHLCCKCGLEMTRETFSIEHIEPWLDSDDPVKLYFDLDNISFSHLSCNISDTRGRQKRVVCGDISNYKRYGCRCDLCKTSMSDLNKLKYSPNKRKQRYLEKGN